MGTVARISSSTAAAFAGSISPLTVKRGSGVHVATQ
jgi:hypothetical protein